MNDGKKKRIIRYTASNIPAPPRRKVSILAERLYRTIRGCNFPWLGVQRFSKTNIRSGTTRRSCGAHIHKGATHRPRHIDDLSIPRPLLARLGSFNKTRRRTMRLYVGPVAFTIESQPLYRINHCPEEKARPLYSRRKNISARSFRRRNFLRDRGLCCNLHSLSPSISLFLCSSRYPSLDLVTKFVKLHDEKGGRKIFHETYIRW